jgi:hypothetical protein
MDMQRLGRQRGQSSHVARRPHDERSFQQTRHYQRFHPGNALRDAGANGHALLSLREVPQRLVRQRTDVRRRHAGRGGGSRHRHRQSQRTLPAGLSAAPDGCTVPSFKSALQARCFRIPSRQQQRPWDQHRGGGSLLLAQGLPLCCPKRHELQCCGRPPRTDGSTVRLWSPGAGETCRPHPPAAQRLQQRTQAVGSHARVLLRRGKGPRDDRGGPEGPP